MSNVTARAANDVLMTSVLAGVLVFGAAVARAVASGIVALGSMIAG